MNVNTMEEKIKILGLAILCCGLMMFVSFCGGWHLRGKQIAPPVADTTIIVTTDSTAIQGTAVRPDADSLIRIDSVPYPVPYPVPQYVDGETIVVHDTIDVYLTREHRLFSLEDTLDVWYSGIDPRIDSAIVYGHHTTEIIRQPYEVAKMPRLTLDLGAAAFYTDNSINPFLVGEMRYNAKKTTWSVYGAVNHEGKWGAGVGVSYRFDIIK